MRGPALKREHILKEIRRIAATHDGRAPGKRAFENETGIRESEWSGVHWARWGDAVAEAGLSANQMVARLDQDDLLAKLAEATRHYTKFPTSIELRMYRKGDPDFPNEKTFYAHFRNRAGILRRLREWTATRPECADILGLLPTDEPTIDDDAAPTTNALRDGYVYLIQSGAFHKIGRSDKLERRVKEITIALPEAVALAHAIRTDDPAGIEAYWHRRFADRRAKGEWFKLTPADVAAFKRRKYQ